MKLHFTLIIIVFLHNITVILNLNLRTNQNSIEKIVSELKNKLPENINENEKFNQDNIFKLIQALLSGTISLSNLSVSQASEFNNITISNKLDAHSQTTFSDEFNINQIIKIGSSLSIVNDTIILEPNSEIKIDSFPMKYKASDLFELISFMKYIQNQCKDEKGNYIQCDFTLLKNKNIN